MRVLMITERYYPIWGGAENQLRQLAQHLNDLGCRVEIITRRWNKRMPCHECVDDVDVHRVGCQGSNPFATVLFIVSMIWKIFRKKKNTDIIHSHGVVAMGAVGWFAARLFGLKNVSKIATAGRILKYKKNFWGSLLLLFFKHSDAIVGMTDEIREELKQIGAPAKRIFHITNAVDCNRFFPYSNKQRLSWIIDRALPIESLIVLFSGRLTFRKGLLVLLDAWCEVEKKAPQAHLFILGSGSAQKNSIEMKAQKKVAEKNLKNVFFEGATTTPESYMGVSDIFILPSFREGMPNALLEAMASGVATIASDIGGVIDLIENGETGMVFNPGDVAELANKVIYLLEHPEIRCQMAFRARRHVLEHYSFESVAKQYMQAYNQILGRKGFVNAK